MHQFQRQSLEYSWTLSLELSADGPQTAGLVIQPFQTVVEDVFIWSAGPKAQCKLEDNTVIGKAVIPR